MGRASGSVSQRNEAQGRLSFDTYAPPSLRGYVRIPVVLTSLKPEAARKSIPDPDRSQPKTSRRSFLLRQLECGEIILHVECRDRRRRRYRRVEDAGCCPLANRSALPTSVMLWAAHLHTPAVPRGAMPHHRRLPACCLAARRNAHCRQLSCRRRKPDSQKQRTSPSACARLSSLIAALACSGDWNIVPNRPGTCERLKNVSAAT
jgi:hypothetical protein